MDDRDEDYYNDEDYSGGDDNQDANFDDNQSPPTEDASQSSTGSSFKVITKDYLLAAQKEDMQRVMDLLSIKEHHARTLLIHHKWDIDKITDVFVNKGKERLYEEACLMVPNVGIISSPHHSSQAFCESCRKEVPANNMTAMDCNHCFCNICWTDYFVWKINEGQSKRINCMVSSCFTICNEEYIRFIVNQKNPDLASKFDSLLLESYLEGNKRVKWCPSVPHCGNAIRIDDDDDGGGGIYREVECLCANQFCFNCCSEPHSPCSCHMWNLWTEKCKEPPLDFSWTSRYYNRFDAHRDSSNFKIFLKDQLLDHMVKLKEPTDWVWLMDAADRYFRSRRILSCSYAFAYYMFGDESCSNEMSTEDKETKQKSFRSRQQQLELCIEKLFYYLQQPFDFNVEIPNELRMHILKLYSLVDDLCKKLYEFIDNELLLEHQLKTKSHIIAPYMSNGPEKALRSV